MKEINPTKATEGRDCNSLGTRCHRTGTKNWEGVRLIFFKFYGDVYGWLGLLFETSKSMDKFYIVRRRGIAAHVSVTLLERSLNWSSIIQCVGWNYWQVYDDFVY